MVILLFSLFGLKSINLGGPESILLKFFMFFLASVIGFRCFLFFVLCFIFSWKKIWCSQQARKG